MAKKKEEAKEKETLKVEKKQTKKKEAKESFFSKIANFFRGVKTEGKRIKWPTKKDMLKYSVATIIFIVFCAAFFYVIDVILALLHTLGK